MNHKITEKDKTVRDDRVAYFYLKLKDSKPSIFIENLIKKLKVTSESTARRVFNKIDKWSKSEKELFLAIYTPVKSDSEAVEEALGGKTGKVSSEVEEEPTIEKLKDGEIINDEGKKYKFVETEQHTTLDCRECDLFSEFLKDDNKKCLCNKYKYNIKGYFVEVAEGEPVSDTLEEIAAKNEELQKEIEEFNEAIKESKIAIMEVCKERDDKSEEIRLLKLELHKYKNDLNAVLDDRQKLECLLHDSIHDNDESKEFRDIIEKMIRLHTSKNKDYGNAFSQSYNEFGAVMSVIRINDKLNRFKTLIRQNNEVKTESITDTLIDLANYAVMTIMELKKQDNGLSHSKISIYW